MYAAHRFACYEQVADGGFTVAVDVDTAVLVVKRGVNENRLFPDVDAVFCEHAQHCRDSLLYRTFAAQQLNHRRIQPHALAVGGLDGIAALTALADNRSRRDVARFQRVHKRFAVLVDELSSQRAHLFGDERAENLRGLGNARGVILQRVGVQKLCAGAVCEHESVGGRAVVVGRREALIMQSARSARGDNHRLCASNENFVRFHIQQHRACGVAFAVLYDFDCRREVDDGNLAVKHFVAERAHDFRT